MLAYGFHIVWLVALLAGWQQVRSFCSLPTMLEQASERGLGEFHSITSAHCKLVFSR
jgi:DNA-binding transcriptional regulator of glucitol operon